MCIIKGWENQQVEFKEEGVEANKLAKELIAFANTNGGIILIGVDDECTIKGITVPKKFEEKIRNIAKNNCNPSIQLETKEYTVDNKKIMGIFVPQGRTSAMDQRNDGKFFVRRGSITGPADPTGVRELTKNI